MFVFSVNFSSFLLFKVNGISYAIIFPKKMAAIPDCHSLIKVI
ncbi:hypothetical protein VFMJ11_A0482 [Aliivibrio fischeri MJ11]|uniref:Uncharacterized protein n=1 Tax=Aliivibrio fischeri (strain MJ11) TaxID=388396 RepID=B5ETL3_ALIFM|nr:hypothetical protein VFMJ11_A0482 [Aliivibrio fischeri MJ11]